MPSPRRADDFHRQHAATNWSNAHESSPPGRAVQQGCDFAQAFAKAISKPATVCFAESRPALLEMGCGNSRPYALSHGSRTGETRFCGLGRWGQRRLVRLSAAVLAGPGGFVRAIEPDVWLAHLLERSAQRIQQHYAGAAQVAVLCPAASEANRIRQLQIAERARSQLSDGSERIRQAGGYRYEQQPVTVSLDFLLDYFPAPSVLKIDVETAEVNVLRGASRLLRSVRPVIWYEVAADNSETVSELLHQGAYELYPAAVEPAKRTPPTRAPWDTLAVPKEQEIKSR